VVVDASGTVKQVTHYYPFGGFFGESTGNSYQAYKYNGKEFERLISEDWYDYGARHMDGMRFTTMDPMAEKYYSISPYAYCANNPIIAIDLDGREVIDMLPAQSKKQQISKQNFYKRWHDNKNSIILLGHGRDRGKTFRTEGAPFTINANSPYSMAFFLEDNSQTWNISSIASDKVELVLFSCETGSYDGLAENLSKQNDFQNISIFAPSESININPDGSVSIDNNGVWREYLNGKVVNEYSGNTVPGTQEFEYSTTWEKKTNNINWQK
jgi:RHS repeat-associated protein